jgi:hypothetical protein
MHDFLTPSSFATWKEEQRRTSIAPSRKEEKRTASIAPSFEEDVEPCFSPRIMQRSDMGYTAIARQKRDKDEQHEEVAETVHETAEDEYQYAPLNPTVFMAMYVGFCIIAMSVFLLRHVTWHGKMAEFVSSMSKIKVQDVNSNTEL